jgi:hypothetical protein
MEDVVGTPVRDEIDEEWHWGYGQVDLSDFKLSVHHKMWIGRRIVRDGLRLLDAVDLYNLNMKTLNKYSNYYLKGIRLHEEGGRPRILDSESMNSVVEFIRSEGPISDWRLRERIRMEAAKSMERNFPTLSLVDKKIISKRTVGRYVILLQELAKKEDSDENVDDD